jgi:hypothetical protein
MAADTITPGALKEDLAAYLEFLTEVAETRVDPLKLTEEYEELSRYYRALGICQLSGEGDVDGFFHYMIQSALTRRHYLQAARAAGGGEPRYRRASLLDPVLDAIAARQWRLAAELFQLVAHAWTEGEEYEDDFCYADFLRLVLTDSRAGIEALLLRWAEVLEGGVDLRIEAELAKTAAIADPIDGSIEAYELTFFPNRWISVEGLALLALAERCGLDVPDLFPACPPLARERTFVAFRSRGYPNVGFVNE